MTIQMKATQECFPVVMFRLRDKAVQAVRSVDETPSVRPFKPKPF